MKKRNYIVQVCGVFAVLASMILTANATALRPSIITRSFSGQILGGFFDVTGPGGGRFFLGSTFNDSSADGNVIVFTSSNAASEFVPGVIGGGATALLSNVFARDLRTGETTCLSCGFAFNAFRAFGGLSPRVTPDGRYAIFSGPSTPDLSSPTRQIFRVDLQTGVKDLVSANPGSLPANGDSSWPVISDNGRYVAFMSTAGDLVSGFSGAGMQVYVRDMQMGQTFLASHAAGSVNQGGNGTVGFSQPLSISSTGRFTAWTSTSSNHSLFIADTNGLNDVFYFDVLSTANNIAVASLNSIGISTANGASTGGIIAAESTNFPPRIVFSSTSTNIDPADTNPAADIYTFFGDAKLVSVGRDGGPSNGASAANASISRNGRYIAFSSNASNLVTGVDEPDNTTSDVFLRDLQTNTTSYISLNTVNSPSGTTNGATLSSAALALGGGVNSYLSRNISDDGRYVGFVTAEPLSIRDSGATQDVYVRDRTAGVSILASLNTGLTGGQNSTTNTIGEIAFAAGGHKVFFSTFATNLSTGDSTTIQNSKACMANISLLSERSVTDVNGDAKNDFTVFRPSEGAWYALYDAANTLFDSIYFGESGDRVVPGDYDGDSRSDYAVFAPSSGRWDILYSSSGELVTKFFGTANDILTPADFDGDGRTDLAYFRPSNGSWNILQSNTNSLRTVRFGLGTDLPVAGDYDGDNRADIAVFRPSTGDWWIQRSTNNSFYMVHWGLGTDKPVPGDYDGDGKTDLAVFRNGDWYISESRSGSFRAMHWGLGSDKPVPSDYDADGKTDLAVYRGSVGDWYVFQSTNSTFLAAHWGTTGDIPVTGAYIP